MEVLELIAELAFPATPQGRFQKMKQKVSFSCVGTRIRDFIKLELRSERTCNARSLYRGKEKEMTSMCWEGESYRVGGLFGNTDRVLVEEESACCA